MMMKPLAILLAAGLMGGWAASWAGPSIAAGSSSHAPASFSVFERETESGSIDLGEEGFSIGDEGAVWTAQLRKHGKVVGHDSGVCFITSTKIPAAQCQITAVFAHGQIAMQVVNDLTSRTNVGIITGGTGAYKGAQGAVRFHFEPLRGGHTITFLFTG
jgi:hypothetical protein